MFLIEQVLPAAALAGAVAVIVSALVRRSGNTRVFRIAVAFLPAAAYGAGHYSVTGGTSFPPTDTTNWLPYFALAAAAVVSLTSLLPSRIARLAIFGLLCVGAMRLLLAPKFHYLWSAEQGWLWVIGLSALILLGAAGVALTERRSSHPVELSLLLSLLPAGTAVALMLSGSLLLGFFAAVLSATFLGNLVLVWRSRPPLDGATAVFSLLHVSLLACGYFFSGLPLLSFVLLALTPLLAAGSERVFGSFVRKLPFPHGASVLHLLSAAALITAALIVTFCSSPPWS